MLDLKCAICMICALLAGACIRPAYERAVGPIDRSDLPLKITRVRGHLYLVEDFNYWKTNSVFYAHPEGIVFFDATWTVKSAGRLIWKAATKSEADYIGLVVTGFPLHRTGGIAAFRSADVRIYMHERTPPLLRDRWDEMQREMAESFGSWRESDLAAPDGIFDRRLSILGGKIKVLYPGPAHTPDNVVAYFTEERVLYGGSLVSDPPMFLRYADFKKYREALHALRRFDFDLVISGHGQARQGPDIIERLMRRIAGQSGKGR